MGLSQMMTSDILMDSKLSNITNINISTRETKVNKFIKDSLLH